MRAKALQVGIKTLPLVVVLTNSNRQAELMLHEQYKDYRLPGSEYFELDKQTTGEAVSAALSYGTVLSDWRNYPTKPACPAQALLNQDYVEVTNSFWRQLLRQIRLRYTQRIECILEYLDLVWDEESVIKFTVYLDVQVQKAKLGKRKNTSYKDWYLRIEACEDYLARLFKQIRVFVPQTLPTIADGSFTLTSGLCFTTVKSNRVIKYENLPLIARVIFERLWNTNAFYSDFLEIQECRHKAKKDWFKYYLESDGPYHYTVGAFLPKPVFF